MKYFIGTVMASIGAKLWENGGWTGEEQYEDLTLLGKIGYNMLCKGLELMGITPEYLDKLTNQIEEEESC